MIVLIVMMFVFVTFNTRYCEDTKSTICTSKTVHPSIGNNLNFFFHDSSVTDAIPISAKLSRFNNGVKNRRYFIQY